MKKVRKLFIAGCMAGCLAMAFGSVAMAAEGSSVLETQVAGAALPLSGVITTVPEDTEAEAVLSNSEAGVAGAALLTIGENAQPYINPYANVAITRVDAYVNIRDDASTTGNVLGKIYNNCAAEILYSVDGEGGEWYYVQSGSVKGYIKAEYFLTGAEAEEVAKEVGRVYATMTAEGLRLREEPNTDSEIITLLAEGERYRVLEEEDDFVKISIDTDMEGYVASEFVEMGIEFNQAISVEEEQAKLEEEARLAREAAEAAERLREAQEAQAQAEREAQYAAAQQTTTQYYEPETTTQYYEPETTTQYYEPETTTQYYEPETTTEYYEPETTTEYYEPETTTEYYEPETTTEYYEPETTTTEYYEPETTTTEYYEPETTTTEYYEPETTQQAVTSAARNSVVSFAYQYLGAMIYSYGGCDLSSGVDCSGFTNQVFANCGVYIPRDSRSQAASGTPVSLDSVQPGDLIFYTNSSGTINHVAIYVGDGCVIHASSADVGVIVSNMYYRTPCCARSYLN